MIRCSISTAEEDTWVPARYALMVVEFVSPGKRNRHRDMVDKPARCAAAGVPYFMRVRIARQLRSVEIELLQLDSGTYKQLAHATGDQQFETDEPFPMSVTPSELLGW